MRLRNTGQSIEMHDAELRFRRGMARRVYERLAEDSNTVTFVVLDLRDFHECERADAGLDFLGYQLCEGSVLQAGKPSTLFLTRRETDLIAGQGFAKGKSQTARFGSDEAARKAFAEASEKATGRVMPLEDSIERAVAKHVHLHHRFGLADRIVSRPAAQV